MGAGSLLHLARQRVGHGRLLLLELLGRPVLVYALVVVVDGHRQHLLGVLLPDDEVVQVLHYLRWKLRCGVLMVFV